MKKLNTRGFGFAVVAIIVVGVAIVGGVGYYVYSTQQNEPEPAGRQSQTTPTPQEPSLCDNPTAVITPDECQRGPVAEKPVIYLYPTETQDVTVQLDYADKLLFTYPDYDEALRGWSVTARPDGTLTNKADGREYSYLFWEGIDRNQYDLRTGFVVKGSDTKAFLQKSLATMGLTPKEYNEMLVYWLPRMQNNNYNLIHFAGDTYTNNAKLTITPTPDSLLRVYMVFRPLDEPVEVKPQTLSAFQRTGFAVVEWGGTEIR